MRTMLLRPPLGTTDGSVRTTEGKLLDVKGRMTGLSGAGAKLRGVGSMPRRSVTMRPSRQGCCGTTLVEAGSLPLLPTLAFTKVVL